MSSTAPELPIVIVGTCARSLFEYLREGLSSELAHYEVHMAGSCDEVRELIEQNHDRIRWVVCDDCLPKDPLGNSAPRQGHPVRDLFEDLGVFSDKATFNAIYCTRFVEEFLDKIPRRLSRKFLALWQSTNHSEFIVTVADMIDATDRHRIYMRPEVIEIEVLSLKTEGCSGQIRSRFKVCPVPDSGPLARQLNRRLSRIPEIVTECRPLGAGKIDFGTLLESVNSLGSTLQELVVELCDLKDQIDQLLWCDSRDSRPPFIQLNLRCKNEEVLSVPIDLTRHQRGTYRKHLASIFPIVWTLDCEIENSQPDTANTISIKRNPYIGGPGAIIAACSFSQDEDLAGIPLSQIPNGLAHCEELKTILRYTSREALEICSDEDWRRVFGIREQTDNRHIRYLLSHGILNLKKPGGTGPAVSGGTVLLNVDLIKSELGSEQRIPFLFLNCCHLGNQANPADAHLDYCGGFLSGALTSGVADEVLAHRWQVPSESARKLATDFFAAHPRTVYSRATSLYFARKAAQKQIDRTDIFWLAPIHAIRRPI